MEPGRLAAAKPQSCFEPKPCKHRSWAVFTFTVAAESKVPAATSDEHEQQQQLHGLSILQSQ
jgi:hypothetical protein